MVWMMPLDRQELTKILLYCVLFDRETAPAGSGWQCWDLTHPGDPLESEAAHS